MSATSYPVCSIDRSVCFRANR